MNSKLNFPPKQAALVRVSGKIATRAVYFHRETISSPIKVKPCHGPKHYEFIDKMTMPCTKPYEFISKMAIPCPKPYEFISISKLAFHGSKPYEFIGKMVIHCPKPYEFIGKIDIQGPKAYEFIGKMAINGPKAYEFIGKWPCPLCRPPIGITMAAAVSYHDGKLPLQRIQAQAARERQRTI